jgi:hypothetical protein
MAVNKQAYVAVAPWTITDVCDALRDAFIDAGMMTNWYDSFTSGGFEHRILEVVYDGAKTYGKTYYWFTFNGGVIAVRTGTGWNSTSHIPCGAGGTAGTQHVDWYVTDTTNFDNATTLLGLSTSISFSVTRYTSSGRSFFVLRTGFTFRTFTIDPVGTTFRTFYDLNLGYHSGIYAIRMNDKSIRITSLHRYRRELFMGSSMNASGSSGAANEYTVNIFSLPVNYNNFYYGTFPNEGFVLPGWTTFANPSAGANFNPVFTQIRLTSIHTSDLPEDFGISAIKNSNILSIQDNATVTAGVEEYEILHFNNTGDNYGVTTNPVFLARII